jgi:hypothetical protein
METSYCLLDVLNTHPPYGNPIKVLTDSICRISIWNILRDWSNPA